ncbi:MAG: HD-GYP domain-containing protein [Clostridium sp.]
MEGLFIKRGNLKRKKTDSLNLLMSNKKMEVVYGQIDKDDGYIVSSYDDINIIEFIYIISGELKFEDGGKLQLLREGDYFYHRQLERTFTMYASKDTKIITFSNTGDFDEVEEQANKLYKVLDDIQEKDNYTKGHCMRVGLYAQKLGNKYKGNIKCMRDFVLAANVHDVGKCMIPDDVLLKPGRFNDEEKKIMMDHSKYSYELLKNGFAMGEIDIKEMEY